MKIGSEAHKELFCKSFMESHLEYEPEKLAWPEADDATLEILRSIPFWEQAISTEQKAGKKVSAFAATVSDPLVREAIALQGMEEKRHARLLEFVIKKYGIETVVRPAPEVPDNLEQDFIDFGYGECLDSFLAFGMFAIARKSGIVPESFFILFDPIMDEEARHIVFFVNWVAYLQVNRGRGSSVLRAANSLWHYSRALKNLINLVNSGNKGEGFTATGATAFDLDLTLDSFLSTCIQENERRMSRFHPDLLKPQLMPALATTAFNTIKLLPKRQSRTPASAALQ